MPRKKNITQATLWGTDSGKGIGDSEKKTRKRKRESDKSLSTKPYPLTPAQIFTVGGYLFHLGKLVGAEEVIVQGEISGFKNHQVGGFFSLKDTDGDGLLKCYMPPRFLSQVGFPLEDAT